jgi:N-acetylmuramoyl-L-alanine amidase
MKICIDPGHGATKVGASFKGYYEAQIVLRIAQFLEVLLVDKGHTVFMTRRQTTYFTPTLSTRADLANQVLADIFISLHTNADPDSDEPGMPEGRGEEIWTYPGSVGGRKLAEALQDSIDKIIPNKKFRGIKEGNFAVLRKTKMPAVLIELGFIDSILDLEVLSNPKAHRGIAKLIAEGIENYVKNQ